MNPIRCITIDDEPLALRLLEEYIAKTADLSLLRAFEDALLAKEFLENQTVDLVFLDIDMPDLNGIDLIKSLPIKPLFVFTTAFKQYALDGFELEAVDYLLKPVDFARFTRAVEKASYLLQQDRNLPNTFISVYSEYRLVKIDVDAIEYIEGMEDYVRIHLSNGRRIMTLSTLKGMSERLPGDLFMRVHRSYIVSLNKIRSLKSRKLKLPSAEITVGASYLAELKSRLYG